MSTGERDKHLYVTVVTPDGPVYLPGKAEDEKIRLLKRQAYEVILPLFDGYLGVQDLHTPTIGKMGYGILEIREKDKKISVYVDGGVVQIKENHISVLASYARAPHQLNKEKLEKELESIGAANSLETQEQKDKLRAQIRLLTQAS